MASAKDHAKKDVEPSFNSLGEISKLDLVAALNWYNLEEYLWRKKKVCDWAKKFAPHRYDDLNNAKDKEFGTMAALILIRSRGAILSAEHEAQIEEWLDNLHVEKTKRSLKVNEAALEIIQKVKKTTLDKNFAEFDDAMERALVGRNSNFPLNPRQNMNMVREVCERELENIKKEPGCHPKEMKSFFQKTLDRITKMTSTVVKAEPKKRAPKKVLPSKVVQKLRSVASFEGVKGKTDFTSLLGAKKAFIYDTKTGALIRAVGGASGLQVDGINLKNLDPKASGVISIKNPKEVLRDGIGIRELDRVFNLSKKPRKVPERIRTQDRMLFLTWG